MTSGSQQKSSLTLMKRATESLEEKHSDLLGTLPQTRLETEYYISFYDDETWTKHVKTIRHKSQAFEKFLEFISWAENQSGKKLKRNCRDGAGEFNNKILKSLCLEREVQWELSAPYITQQNGKAERFNCTLMSSASSIVAERRLTMSI